MIEINLNYNERKGEIQEIPRALTSLKYFYENAPQYHIVCAGSLLGALSNLDSHTFIEGNRLFTEFKGALTEQFVCQEMKAATGIDLYYWSAENAMAEIDFLIQQNENIIPIEVKAETNLQAKSLKSYISRYLPNYAIRFSLADYKAEEIIRNIPLYDVRAFEFLEENL